MDLELRAPKAAAVVVAVTLVVAVADAKLLDPRMVVVAVDLVTTTQPLRSLLPLEMAVWDLLLVDQLLEPQVLFINLLQVWADLEMQAALQRDRVTQD